MCVEKKKLCKNFPSGLVRTLCAVLNVIRHPERSEAESNFFVLDPKRHCAPFAPHYVRSSTALRMTQTKKCRAKRGRIYKEVTHTHSLTQQCGRALCTSRKERPRKVLVKLFQKLVGSQGDALRRTPQSAKYPQPFGKRRRG